MTSHYRFMRVVFLEWPRDGMIAMGKAWMKSQPMS